MKFNYFYSCSWCDEHSDIVSQEKEAITNVKIPTYWKEIGGKLLCNDCYDVLFLVLNSVEVFCRNSRKHIDINENMKALLKDIEEKLSLKL